LKVEAAGAAVFMGGVLPWQKSCDIVSGCIYFIGEMIWCVQPQLSPHPTGSFLT
jgi:hypothetical protein